MTETADPRRERFQRLATARTNAVLDKLDILGNCSNRQAYEYDDSDLDAIFSAILRKVRQTKARFGSSKKERFSL